MDPKQPLARFLADGVMRRHRKVEYWRSEQHAEQRFWDSSPVFEAEKIRGDELYAGESAPKQVQQLAPVVAGVGAEFVAKSPPEPRAAVFQVPQNFLCCCCVERADIANQPRLVGNANIKPALGPENSPNFIYGTARILHVFKGVERGDEIETLWCKGQRFGIGQKDPARGSRRGREFLLNIDPDDPAAIKLALDEEHFVPAAASHHQPIEMFRCGQPFPQKRATMLHHCRNRRRWLMYVRHGIRPN
jgi:hypothetical protein